MKLLRELLFLVVFLVCLIAVVRCVYEAKHDRDVQEYNRYRG